MKKTKINVFDHAEEILKAVKAGCLITAKAGGRVNSMVIGWGMLGIDWSTPIFITFVREGRFTRTLLDENPEFTVNVQLGKADRKAVAVCGSRSGRDIDKIAEAGLTPVASEQVAAPGYLEFPLTLECKVVCRQEQPLSLIDPKFMTMYPQNVPSTAPGATKDPHVMYYGEIVDAYIIEED